jgi:flagellin
MSMVINTNVTAMSSARLLNDSTARLSKSLARLSSGSKIVSPADDAAGLAQSMKFEAQINRNNAANSNIGNAISFSQTQDGFLQKVTKALDRMSELSIAAQDATKTDTDRENYNIEFGELKSYISDIKDKTFNGVALFGATGLNVTIDSDGTLFAMNAANVATDVNTVITGESVDTAANAIAALAEIKTAIQGLADIRANVGANLQRLNLTSEQISILNENLSAANSRIVDVDVAQESTQFARNNILVQSGTAMLAQANMLPQSALRLLG